MEGLPSTHPATYFVIHSQGTQWMPAEFGMNFV